MIEPHLVLNGLSGEDARRALTRCCGASRWVAGMLARRPFPSAAALYAGADEVWTSLARADFLEAFSHHPQIGGEGGAPATATWSRQEQAAVSDADDRTRIALRAGNLAYLRRFGFIYIVCASGKSGEEMLAMLEQRLGHDDARELEVAAGEQARITRLRLEKLGA